MRMKSKLAEIEERLKEIEAEITAGMGLGEVELITLEHSTKFLRNMHKASVCKGQHCTMHNRSDHHMRSFPQLWQDYYMWRVCSHGLRHPDPDEINKDAQHDCDTCCYLKENLDD